MKSTPLVKNTSGTIISVNQLCIYGAVADMCNELVCRISDCSERTGELVAQDNSKTTVIPTELMATNKSPRTDENLKRNLLHNFEKNWKSSISSSIDQAMPRCRYHADRGDRTLFHDPRQCGTEKNWEAHVESTLSSKRPLFKVKGWIRGNTKIAPALEVAVTHHQGRYGIEIMIQLLIWRWNSFLGDDHEWNQQTRDGDGGGNRRRPHRLHRRKVQGNFVAKARPKQTPTPTNSSPTVTSPNNQRDWIDVEPGPFDRNCFAKCQKRCSDCFDTILQHFEKKTEQSNSESWHRCLHQNLRLLRIGQFEHG